MQKDLSVVGIVVIRILGLIVVGGFFSLLAMLVRSRQTIEVESPALMLGALGALSLAVAGAACRWVGAEAWFRTGRMLGTRDAERIRRVQPWRFASSILFAVGLLVMCGVVLIALTT